MGVVLQRVSVVPPFFPPPAAPRTGREPAASLRLLHRLPNVTLTATLGHSVLWEGLSLGCGFGSVGLWGAGGDFESEEGQGAESKSKLLLPAEVSVAPAPGGPGGAGAERRLLLLPLLLFPAARDVMMLPGSPFLGLRLSIGAFPPSRGARGRV